MRYWLLGVVAVLLLAIGLLLTSPRAKVRPADQPIVVMPSAGETPKPNGLEAHASAMKSSNSSINASSLSGTGGSCLLSRSFAILLNCDHPLLDTVARRLQKELAAIPNVERVTYYPYGTKIPEGQMLPDIFVTLDMSGLKERSLPFSRDLEASVSWNWGTSIMESNVTTFEPGLSLARFGGMGAVDHQSEWKGVSVFRGRYEEQAASIAQEIGKSMASRVKEAREKYHELPALPRSCYGPWSPPPKDLVFSGVQRTEQIVSGYRLFETNETAWRLTDEVRTTTETLRAVRNGLVARGWKARHEYDIAGSGIELTRGIERLFVFPRRRSMSRQGLGDGPSSVSGTYFAIYKLRFSADRARRALEDVLRSQPDLPTLLAFSNHIASPEQQVRLVALMKEQTGKDAAECLDLAQFWFDAKDRERMAASLRRARVFQSADTLGTVSNDAVKQAAHEFKRDDIATATLTAQDYVAAGFQQVGKIREPLVITKGIEEPLLMFDDSSSTQIKTLTARVLPGGEVDSQSKTPVESYRLRLTTKSGDGGMSGESGIPFGFRQAYDFGDISVTVTLPNQVRYTFAPAKSAPPKAVGLAR